MARLSADIKERFFGSVRSTWSTVQNFTSFRSMPQSDGLDVQCLVCNNYVIFHLKTILNLIIFWNEKLPARGSGHFDEFWWQRSRGKDHHQRGGPSHPHRQAQRRLSDRLRPPRSSARELQRISFRSHFSRRLLVRCSHHFKYRSVHLIISDELWLFSSFSFDRKNTGNLKTRC